MGIYILLKSHGWCVFLWIRFLIVKISDLVFKTHKPEVSSRNFCLHSRPSLDAIHFRNSIDFGQFLWTSSLELYFDDRYACIFSKNVTDVAVFHVLSTKSWLNQSWLSIWSLCVDLSVFVYIFCTWHSAVHFDSLLFTHSWNISY